MLMKDHPKKPMVEIIMGKIGKKGPEDTKEAELDTNVEAEAAAEDLLNAIKSGDKKLLLDAFQAMMACCDNMDAVEDENMEEE